MKNMMLFIFLLNANHVFTQVFKECIVKQNFDTIGSDTIVGLKQQFNNKNQLISEQYTGYRLSPVSWGGDASIQYFYKDDLLTKEKTTYRVTYQYSDSIVTIYSYDSLKRINKLQIDEYFLNEKDQQRKFSHHIFYFYNDGKIAFRINKNLRGEEIWKEKYIYFKGGYSIETKHDFRFRSVNRKIMTTYYTNDNNLVTKEITYFKKDISSIKLYFYDSQNRVIKTQFNDMIFIDNKLPATISNYYYN